MKTTIFTLSGLVVGVIIGVYLNTISHPPPSIDSEEKIVAKLTLNGVNYDYKRIGLPDGDTFQLQGVHLKLCGDPRPWSELTERLHPTKAHVIIRPRMPGVPCRDVYTFQGFEFYGDREHILKILDSLNN